MHHKSVCFFTASSLWFAPGDLERAVGSLVATVTHDPERDSHSSDEQPELEQYDNNPMPAEKDR